jgi:hypothetical protein
MLLIISGIRALVKTAAKLLAEYETENILAAENIKGAVGEKVFRKGSGD